MRPWTFFWTRYTKSLSLSLCSLWHRHAYADNSKGITQTYSVKSGQGFLIFPGQITTYFADQEHPWEYVWLEFDGLKVKEAFQTTSLSLEHPVYRANSKELREILKNEMLYIVEHRMASKFHLIGHLYLFLDALTQSLILMN